VKHQQHADKVRRAQVKRKYIASDAAPSAEYQAKLEASGGIVAVSSLSKNKLDFSGGKSQHTRFNEDGQAIKQEPSSAAAAAAAACCCWSRGGAAAQILPKLAGQVDELKQHRLLPASSRLAQVADSTAQTREINKNNQARFGDRG